MSEMDYKFKVSCTRCDIEYDSDYIMYCCPKCLLGGLVHERQSEQKEESQ
jgi:predicted RNA-binding Zn-ribbon protein involved in translation (DUF1610 family)